MAFFRALGTFLLIFVAGCQGTLIRPTNVDPPQNVEAVASPEYTIDLGLPPHSRWNQSIASLVELRGYDDSLGVYARFMDMLIGTKVAALLEPALQRVLDDYFPEDMASELRGIVGVVADLGYGEQLPFSYIVLMNLMYEESVFCTSIVGHRSDGVIIHGRNLDYGIAGLENLAVQLHFMNSSSGVSDVQYSGNSFLGSVGLLNGVNPQFSVSFNQRSWMMGLDYFKDWKRPHIGVRDVMGFLHNVILGKEGYHSSMLLVRETLQSPEVAYSDALDIFTNTKMISPLYFIIGGKQNDEGAVITRWPDKADVWPMDSSAGAWYRLQTNYDHWKPVPLRDDRRTPGNSNMLAVGPDAFDEETMWNVLATVPTLNNSTKYTSIMSASAQGFINTSSWLQKH